jgi:hypothetical protein
VLRSAASPEAAFCKLKTFRSAASPEAAFCKLKTYVFRSAASPEAAFCKLKTYVFYFRIKNPFYPGSGFQIPISSQIPISGIHPQNNFQITNQKPIFLKIPQGKN